MAGIGTTEIILVLVIVVLIFGVGKIADVGPALGKAISGFRSAVREDEEGEDAEAAASEAEPEQEED
jgi:sec-independent protein translocase protein TatA